MRGKQKLLLLLWGFDLSGISEAATRVENAIHWSIGEHDYDDDSFFMATKSTMETMPSGALARKTKIQKNQSALLANLPRGT